jgi:ribose transport system substrate-binding protein
LRRIRSRVALAVAGTLAVSIAAAASAGASSGGQYAAHSASSSATATAKASAAIAPYVGKPSAFPVTQALKRRPVGARIDYMDCGTPVCALFYQLLQPAAKTMGVKLIRIDAGQAASTVSNAFDTAITQKPAALIVTAINVQLWGRQLKTLEKDKIPVVTTGITGLAPYHVEAPQAAEGMAHVWGKLSADYIAAKFGQKSHVVYYPVPELPFTLLGERTFKAELANVCPHCTVRSVNIAAATMANTAPQTIVSDLEAHSGTTVAVFSSDEEAIGLPAALKSAGITKVKTLGIVPTPANLQYVKQGQETVSLGYDLPVASWELVDQAAREIEHQALTGPEAKGVMDVEFLTAKDITFNPANGWTGYPTFAKRFAKLWGVR